MSALGTCRGCPARIRWITTKAGRPMPCDPEKVQEWIIDETVAPPGSVPLLAPIITLVTEDGEVVRGSRGTVIAPGARSVEGYVPHFATCPKSKEFQTRPRAGTVQAKPGAGSPEGGSATP